MKLHELHKQIVDNTLDNFYIFAGPELGIMDIYLDQIAKTSGVLIERAESVEAAYGIISKPRMVTKPRVIVVRDDKDFIKAEKIWDKVKTGVSKTNDRLILLFSSIDKRSKFWKSYQDEVIMFERLESQVLSKYIEKELPGMPVGDRIALAEVCECDYSRILLECDKIRQYFSVVHSLDYGACFHHLLEQGVIYQPIGDITFKFTDAIVLRDVAGTAEYLLQAKAKQEPEIMVLSVLYNAFKHVLMVQGLGSNDNLSQRTGLTPWQVKQAKDKMGHYTLKELLEALKVIRFTEKAIKTGQIEIGAALDYVIVNVMI